MGQILTVLLTVISGVFVYVFCEFIKEIWLCPLQEYKKLRNRVSFTLSAYSINVFDKVDVLTSGKKLLHYDYDIASKEFLTLSSEIRGFIETLSWFRIGIPSKKRLYDTSISLSKISFALLDENNIPVKYDIYHFCNMNYASICANLKIYRG